VSIIKNAINCVHYSCKENLLLHVSVSAEPEWVELGSGNVLVRYMCWSVLDSSVGEIIPPTVEVLSDRITEQQLADELPAFFEGIAVIVDDDIEFD